MSVHPKQENPLSGKLMLPVVELYLDHLRKRAEKKRKPGQKNPVDLTGRPGVLRSMAKAWDAQRPQKFYSSLNEVWLEDYFTEELHHLGPNTRRGYRAYVRMFIEWGQKRDKFAPRIEEFDAGDCDKKNLKPPLWKPAQFYKELYESQDWYFRGVFAFLTYTLVRGSEAITLKVRDLDLDSGYVNTTRHKTGDFDMIPILEDLDVEMRRYLIEYQKCVGGPLHGDMYLFPRFLNNRAGTAIVRPYEQRYKLSYTCHERIVAALPEHERSDPYITRGIGSHSVRRSMARAMFEWRAQEMKDSDAMRQVQGMLGHADVEMTQRYIGKESIKETRDAAFRGARMFAPSGQVIPLRQAAG